MIGIHVTLLIRSCPLNHLELRSCVLSTAYMITNVRACVCHVETKETMLDIGGHQMNSSHTGFQILGHKTLETKRSSGYELAIVYVLSQSYTYWCTNFRKQMQAGHVDINSGLEKRSCTTEALDNFCL